MSIYITQGRYTAQAIKGLVDVPEDRMNAVKGLMKRAGGKLLSYYITFGEYDFLIISDMPSPQAVMSALAAAGAGGGVTDLRTTLAVTTAEAKEAFAMAGEQAAKFHSAGSA